jgi:hypothetical protein
LISRKSEEMQRRVFLNLSISFIVILLFQGCATVKGPSVSSIEEEKAKREIQLRSIRNWVRDTQRVSATLYNIRKIAPSKDSSGFLGIIDLPLNNMKPENRAIWEVLMGRSLPKTGYLLLPVPGSPAERAGIKLYDIALEALPDKIQPDEYVLIKLEDRCVEFPAEKVGVKLNKMTVVSAAEVNAYVDVSKNLYVKNNLLKFVPDDNQLAIILGHELAHIERGHVETRMGTVLLVSILTLAAEAVITQGQGTGDLSRLATQAIVGKFSRDQEREADYFGLKFAHLAGYDTEKGADVWLDLGGSAPASLTKNLLSSHPPSSERLARLRKITSLLKEGKGWEEFEGKQDRNSNSQKKE